MTEPDYEADLAELRQLYVEATPRQRLHIAQQRIRYPEHDPNRLVAYVSAVEGFARCLALHVRARSKTELSAVYASYRRKGAEELIEEYLAARELGQPKDFFGAQTWERFHYAVEYRNLLVHECTYLGQDHSPALVAACRAVLLSLAASQELEVDEA